MNNHEKPMKNLLRTCEAPSNGHSDVLDVILVFLGVVLVVLELALV